MSQHNWERRALDSLAASENGRTLVGYAVVFGSLSHDLGGWREIIEPSAVDRTLREASDVRALLDHDTAKMLGRTTAGTLRIAKDDRGLRVEIDMPDVSYASDAIALVKRRDLSGMSFAFSVVQPHGERFDQRGTTPTRIISDMLIHEVSIVSMPAYAETDVAVAKRSLEQFRKQGPRVEWLAKRLAIGA